MTDIAAGSGRTGRDGYWRRLQPLRPGSLCQWHRGHDLGEVAALLDRSAPERDDFVFDPIHYLPLLEHKTGALDQAAPLAGWDLPEEFGTLRRLLESRMGRRGKSNCLKSQEVRPSTCGLRSHQGERCLSMELRITSSLRMQAVRATFFGLPAVNSRW